MKLKHKDVNKFISMFRSETKHLQEFSTKTLRCIFVKCSATIIECDSDSIDNFSEIIDLLKVGGIKGVEIVKWFLDKNKSFNNKIPLEMIVKGKGDFVYHSLYNEVSRNIN